MPELTRVASEPRRWWKRYLDPFIRELDGAAGRSAEHAGVEARGDITVARF